VGSSRNMKLKYEAMSSSSPLLEEEEEAAAVE
jgi:hypothetical protein